MDKLDTKIEYFFIDVEVKSDMEIISILADKMFEKGLVKNSFKNAVVEREKNFPTGLPIPGFGIAIPHSDCVHVIRPSFAIAKLKTPIQFGEMGGDLGDKVDVNVVIMMGLLDDKAQVPTIVKILDIFSDPMIINRIKQVETRKEFHDVLTEIIKI